MVAVPKEARLAGAAAAKQRATEEQLLSGRRHKSRRRLLRVEVGEGKKGLGNGIGNLRTLAVPQSKVQSSPKSTLHLN